MKVKSPPYETPRAVSDEVLDDLERLVIRVCDVPIALINSVDAERRLRDVNKLKFHIFIKQSNYTV